jgi:hypothetical protein
MQVLGWETGPDRQGMALATCLHLAELARGLSRVRMDVVVVVVSVDDVV